MNRTLQTLPLDLIRTDGRTRVRVVTDSAVVEDYAAALQAGATLPLVVVFHDGEQHWLADGFYTLAAHRMAGRSTIDAEVKSGTRRDARLHAAGANAAHGARRTNADKRAAVLVLLEDSEWSGWSDGEIARHCSVSQPFVSKLRRELTQNRFESPTLRKGADGRTINTARIGKPAPPPMVTVWPELPAEAQAGQTPASPAEDDDAVEFTYTAFEGDEEDEPLPTSAEMAYYQQLLRALWSLKRSQGDARLEQLRQLRDLAQQGIEEWETMS